MKSFTGRNLFCAFVLIVVGLCAIPSEGGQAWEDGLAIFFGVDISTDPHILGFVFTGVDPFFGSSSDPNYVDVDIHQGSNTLLRCFGVTSYDPVEVNPKASFGVVAFNTADVLCAVNTVGATEVVVVCQDDGVEFRHDIETQTSDEGTVHSQVKLRSAGCTLQAGSLSADFTVPPACGCGGSAGRVYRRHDVTTPN